MPDPMELINLLFTLIYLSILARIILTLALSFMAQDPPPMLVNITQVFVQITEPILAPIRRVLPNFGMIDFSPMVAIFLLIIIQRIIAFALVQ